MSRFSFFIPGAGFTGVPGFRFIPDQGLVAIKEATLSSNASQVDRPFIGEMKLGAFVFPLDPIVQVQQGKKIVKTELSGFPGTVKEDMGSDDYRISILAVLQNEDSDEYPEFLVSSLRAEIEKPGALPIYNKLLSVYNITNIAIENVEFETPEGYGAQVIVRISALSDFLPEVILMKMLQA